MQKRLLFISTTFMFSLFLSSCSPSLKYTSIKPSKTSKPSGHNIIVYPLGSSLPSNATIIGSIYIGDTGFSMGCGYDDVLNIAKRKAREVGGDAIQITEVKTPDLSSTCYRIRANIIAFREIKSPPNWPTISWSEQQFKDYLDENTENLNPIEGIWTVTEGGTWHNLSTGTNGNIPDRNPYRLAIIQNTRFPNYDFVAVVLESEYSYWKPGNVKAHFRNTVYNNIFEALWYMNDYSEKKTNYILDETGLLKTQITSYNNNIEFNVEETFIKAYPPLTGTFKTSFDKSLKTSGSGFLLTINGLVVTNYHVVGDARRIEVVFPEKSITKQASIKIKDSQNDIAILELKDFIYSEIFKRNIPFNLADVNSIKVGQEVFTLGFPFGDIMGTKSRLSTGRINSQFGLQDDPRLFQISNPLQPGNSGGPLFTTTGQLAGIVVSSLNAKYFYENIGIIPQNVNFAIKATYLQNIISMIPEADEALKRKNLVKPGCLEDKIEQLSPYIVQVKIY